MTAAETMPTDAWMERCLICITKQGGSDIEFSSITDSVKLSPGAKDVDQSVLVNGGRVVTFKPEEMGEIVIKGFPINAATTTGTTTATGYEDLKAGGIWSVSAEPQVVSSDFNRYKHRVVVLWTTDSATIKATSAPTAGKRAIRFMAAECYVTNVEPDEFTAENPKKATVTLKFAAFDKSANRNYDWQETDGSATIAAISAYTSTTKW